MKNFEDSTLYYQGSKLQALGMVIPPFIGIVFQWVYSPLLQGWWSSSIVWFNNAALDLSMGNFINHHELKIISNYTPKKGPFQKGNESSSNHSTTIFFTRYSDIREFSGEELSWATLYILEFLQAKHSDSSSPDRTRKTSWPISLPANKVCNVSDFLKSEHHFFFGGGRFWKMKNENHCCYHSTTVLHNWSLTGDKPLQLYLQKPAFCQAPGALKRNVIVHY